MDEPVGFIGLGHMGEPMALNLVRAGIPLVVWNRSPRARQVLAGEGAVAVETSDAVFRRARTVVMMLANGTVIDEVLGRGELRPAAAGGGELSYSGSHPARFERLVRDHTLIHMGTTAPEYSRGLADDVSEAGGRYVEAPVSGSRKPAEAGELVNMVAADDEAVLDELAPLWPPMCRTTVRCGRVPLATVTKLAVNVFLIAMVTGLAEAVHFAQRHGIDLATVLAVLDAGPMSSDVSRVKGAKLVTPDFDAQASVSDVLYNSSLISEAARASMTASPLLSVCERLYREAELLGHGQHDMVAVLKALEARSNDPQA